MNLVDLKQKLEELGVPKDAYSFSGKFPNETFCIVKTNVGWEVYYSERGNKSMLKIFSAESEACDYFYEFITSDSIIMRNLNKS